MRYTISQNTPTERPLPAFSCLLRMFSEISSPLKESLVNIFFYSIFDNAEIHETTQTVSRLYFEIEQGWQDLRYNKIDFINSWATDHNDFFSTAKENLDEISLYIAQIAQHLFAASGYSPSDEIGNSNPGDVQERALAPSLNGNAVQGLFWDNSYPPEVKNLISNITRFLGLYYQCRHFCEETFNEEVDMVCKDEGAERLYKRFVRKAMKTAKEATKYFSADKVEELKRTLRIYRDYEKWNSFEKFTFFGYHKYTPEEVNLFIMILCFELENNIFTPTQEEISIFGEKQKEEEMRYIIQHFDDLLPLNMIQTEFAFYQYALAKWADVPVKGFVEFFNQEYTGKWKATKSSNVYNQNMKYNKKSDEVKGFEFAIKNLLNSKKEHTSQTETA